MSEVKPLLQVNAYTCDQCGAEIFQDVSQRKLTPLTECISEVCVQNQSRGQLHMQTRACKFTPFQECKIQEMVSRSVYSLVAVLTLSCRLIKYRLDIFLVR